LQRQFGEVEERMGEVEKRVGLGGVEPADGPGEEGAKERSGC